MKKSTVRLAVVSACVGAGLVLSGCGGGSDEAAGTDTAAEEQGGAEESADEAAAEEAPAEAEPATEEDLIAAVEAGGFTAEVADAEALSGAAGAMGDITVEPAECEVFMNAALTAAEEADTTVVTGLPAESSASSIGGALGYPSADDALAAMETNSDSLGTCSDITVTMQDMELATSTTEIDAEVEGADAVFATEVEMDVAGQSMTTTSIQALKGSAVLTVTGTSGAGVDGASIEDMSTTAADMVAALP